jgi:SAM-dependent methyltransferase
MPEAGGLLRWYREHYWTQYAGEQRGAARENLYRHVMHSLSRRVPEPGTLIDVGCGLGALLAQARACGWKAIGFDPSPSAVAEARAQGLDARESAWPPSDLPDESADAVVFINVLDHLLNPFAALQEARRVLRAGGLVYVRVPNVPLHMTVSRVLSMIGVEDVTVMHLHGFGPRALRHHLLRLGFRRVVIRAAPPSQYDAYASTGFRAWLKAVDGAAYQVSAITGLDRLAWGPSIEAIASKAPDTSKLGR